MAKKNQTYTSAINELHKIIDKIENLDGNIDELEKYMIKANELFKFCKSKLSATENVVNEFLKDE